LPPIDPTCQDARLGRAAADVQDDDVALLAQMLVDGVGVGGRGRLAEHSHGLQAGKPPGEERRVVAERLREGEAGRADAALAALLPPRPSHGGRTRGSAGREIRPWASSSRPSREIHRHELERLLPSRPRASSANAWRRRAKRRRRTEARARDGTQLGWLRPPFFGGRSQPTSGRNIPSWSQPNPLVFHPNSRKDGSAPTRLAPLSNQTHG